MTKVKFQDCLAEWLRGTTHFGRWEVRTDQVDVWMQYITGLPVEMGPHYAIHDELGIVEACCPHDNVFWELNASDPNFFTLLAKKMETDATAYGKAS